MKHLFMVFRVVVVLVSVSKFLSGCTTQATVSAREMSDVVLDKPYGEALYNGCFWNDRLWEDNWAIKKDRRHTLKLVRVRLSPWQSFAAVCTMGIWVPMYIEWELNGDRK